MQLQKELLHHGTVVTYLTSSLLQPMVQVKSYSSVYVPVLCSLAREGGHNLLCLVLWKLRKKPQMCWYCVNFLISDPKESFVMYFKLSHHGFFHCYAAVTSPAMRGQYGKCQQFIIRFSLFNVSNCLQPVCLSAIVVWRHVIFSCDIEMTYCEMVFVQVLQVGYMCAINYVHAQ